MRDLFNLFIAVATSCGQHHQTIVSLDKGKNVVVRRAIVDDLDNLSRKFRLPIVARFCLFGTAFAVTVF